MSYVCTVLKIKIYTKQLQRWKQNRLDISEAHIQDNIQGGIKIKLVLCNMANS
jgi:hypothetical protein